jgi:membrane fusion protein, multidrug efflux system
MNTRRYILPAVVITMLFSGCNNQSSTTSSDVEISVQVTEVKKSSIFQSIESNGTVTSSGEAELSTEAEGKYSLCTNPSTGRPYKLGDRVKKGDAIIALENAEYEYSIRIETKKLDLDISQSEYEKQKSLYEKGGVTLREMKDAEVSFLGAKYDYENAELQLSKLKVAAPFNGVIVSLPYYTPGVKIASGTTVVKIMDYQNLILDIDLPEKYLSEVTVGQQAKITNYNLAGDTLLAAVSQLSPAINESSRTFQGMLTISNPDLKFRPGMFVKAQIITEQRDSSIVIPRDIIKKGRRGEVVYVVDRNTAVERQIVKGIETNDEVEIIKGLEVGDRLVTDGYEMLSNRAKVKIIN